jgi:hypothetical protein
MLDEHHQGNTFTEYFSVKATVQGIQGVVAL